FRYNDLAGLRALLREQPVAAVSMERESVTPPAPGFLEGVRHLCDEHGTVLIFDEMITGFRRHPGGAAALYGVTPDLSAFGKGIGNGCSVAALVGRRELMERGGLRTDQERVFLLSTTHGAETHALAAALATIRTYRTEPVVEHLYRQGERLAEGVRAAAARHGVSEHVGVMSRP